MSIKTRVGKVAIAALVALATVWTISSPAAAVSFSPTGLGPGDPNRIDLAGIDWASTSFLALGGTTAIGSCAPAPVTGACTSPAAARTFEVLTMARIALTRDSSSTVNTPAGLNTAFEITMLARLAEVVTNVFGTTALFQTVPTLPSFLSFYFDSNPPTFATDLTGSGFNNGKLILTGTLANVATTNFTVIPGAPVPIDQFPPATPGDDYIELTVQGAGGTSQVQFNVTGTDPNFFLQSLASVGILFGNISETLPFDQVEPADCFPGISLGTIGGAVVPAAGSPCNAHAHRGPPLPGYGPYVDAAGSVFPTVGLVNGLFPSAGGGPDFVAQTHFNASLVPAAVPQPMSLVLLGVALSALGALGLIRTRRHGSLRH